MQLIINTRGSYLHKKGECFEIRSDNKKHEISCKKVSSIIISTAVNLTSDAIKLAMENNIDIIFLDEFGNPYGRVWHSRLGSTTAIRRRQLEIAETKEGLDLASGWIKNKINNKIALLQDLRKTRSQKSAKITEYIKKIENIAGGLENLDGTIHTARSSIMGIEGSIGRIYFEVLSFLIPERFKFQGRSRNPAQDEFNCLLNYAYGVLYSRVEKCCIIAGLDPYVGFIHTDHYNKKSLVFDLIENYRIWADETVIRLFAKRAINKELFDQIPKGLTLNKDGKVILMSGFNEFLEERIRHKKRDIKRTDIIQFDCHRIANDLIRDKKE